LNYMCIQLYSNLTPPQHPQSAVSKKPRKETLVDLIPEHYKHTPLHVTGFGRCDLLNKLDNGKEIWRCQLYLSDGTIETMDEVKPAGWKAPSYKRSEFDDCMI